jgi:hypothetical protein
MRQKKTAGRERDTGETKKDRRGRDTEMRKKKTALRESHR